MQVVYLPSNLANIPKASAEFRASAVAIGNFDGVHIGHQAVISKLKELAGSQPFGIYTLYPHPREVFNPKVPLFYLTPLQEKLDLLASLGVSLAWVQTFDADFAHVSAEAFVERVIACALKVSWLVVGKDFCFGHGRRGNIHTLKRLGDRLGFCVHTPEIVCHMGTPVSSSWIKEVLSAQRVNQAAELLGRPYSVKGVVEHGVGRGRSLGFPTANLLVDPKKYLPAMGVYAGFVHLGQKTYCAVANLGQKPTFNDPRVSLEVHLLGFEGQLYGQSLLFDFIDFLRPQRSFSSPLALARQIQADIQEALNVLTTKPDVCL